MSLQAKYTDLIQRWGFSQHIYIYFFFIPEDHSHVFYSLNVSLIVFLLFSSLLSLMKPSVTITKDIGLNPCVDQLLFQVKQLIFNRLK